MISREAFKLLRRNALLFENSIDTIRKIRAYDDRNIDLDVTRMQSSLVSYKVTYGRKQWSVY